MKGYERSNPKLQKNFFSNPIILSIGLSTRSPPVGAKGSF